jgi:phage N-6-adenine-methyltransferase
MTLVGFKGKNHPQQIDKRGAIDFVDDRGTDPALFAELDARFGPFTLDVAAAPHNAKCERYYTKEDNGLVQKWSGIVWCNPPYSTYSLGAFVLKAWYEARWCERIVMLVPANRPEQDWWQDLVEPDRDQPDSPLRVEFLRGRRRFIMPGKTSIEPNQRPPFGVALLIWEAR